MIELSFWNFHEQNYEDKDYCLYVMKNGFGGILYIGISNVDILEDCIEFCGNDIPSHNSRTIQAIEPIMIKKLSPVLNTTYNYNPGKDTTPKSEKEKAWEKHADQAYDEIFNKKK